MGDVEMVRAPVCNLARAVIGNSPPPRKSLARIEIARLRRPLPHFPIHSLRDGNGRENFGLEVRRKPYFYSRNAPEVSVADYFGGADKVGQRPLP